MSADPMYVSSPKKYFSEEADNSFELKDPSESQHYISPETSKSQLLENDLTIESTQSFEDVNTLSSSSSADNTVTIFQLEDEDREKFLSSSTTINKSECDLIQRVSLIRVSGNHELKTIDQECEEDESRQRALTQENNFKQGEEKRSRNDSLHSRSGSLPNWSESEEWDALSEDSDMDFFLKNYPLIKGVPNSPLRTKRIREEPKKVQKSDRKLSWKTLGKVAIPAALSLMIFWAFQRKRV